MTESERIQRQLLEECEEIISHVRLLRDYATTPDNVWLARGELERINSRSAAISDLLAQLKQAD